MKIEAFEDGLDRFGGDFDRWPADLRGPAERLLASSAEAQALKAEMDTLEACLRASSAAAMPFSDMPFSDMPFSDMPFTDMAAVAMRQRQVRAVPVVRRQVAAWGAATVAALVLGIVIGNLQYIGKVQYEGHEDAPDQVVARALGVPGATDVD